MNNYNNIFIVEGALQSLSYFPLNINVNDILNYSANYLIRKRLKKLGRFY